MTNELLLKEMEERAWWKPAGIHPGTARRYKALAKVGGLSVEKERELLTALGYACVQPEVWRKVEAVK